MFFKYWTTQIKTTETYKYCNLLNVSFQLKLVNYLYVSVGLICLVLYLKKIIYIKMCILYRLVLLNSILF